MVEGKTTELPSGLPQWHTMVEGKTTELPSGLPQWHTVLTVVLLFACFAPLFPSFESIDEVATLDTFSKRVFPDILSLQALIVIRATTCAFIFACSGYSRFFAGEVKVVPPYLPKSKLKRNIELVVRGWFTQAPFTMWSWNLLGLSFGLNAYLAYQRLQGEETASPVLLRTALLLFETSAPVTVQIAFLVRFVLWPEALKNGIGKDPTATFKLIRQLAYHNLNVVLALTEISLLGGIPVSYTDFPVGVFYGLAYVLFTWAIRNHWDPTGKGGPQFLYFFFDTTLGATTTIVILALLLVFVIFYGLFCVIHQILDQVSGGFLVHALCVILMPSTVCRFRD